MSPTILIQLLGIARLVHHRQKTVPLGSRQNKNTSFAYPRYDVASGRHLKGYFCSDTFFNLIQKVMTDTKNQILEKGLNFAPIQNKINETSIKR